LPKALERERHIHGFPCHRLCSRCSTPHTFLEERFRWLPYRQRGRWIHWLLFPDSESKQYFRTS